MEREKEEALWRVPGKPALVQSSCSRGIASQREGLIRGRSKEKSNVISLCLKKKKACTAEGRKEEGLLQVLPFCIEKKGKVVTVVVV